MALKSKDVSNSKVDNQDLIIETRAKQIFEKIAVAHLIQENDFDKFYSYSLELSIFLASKSSTPTIVEINNSI
jgi:hypothetical protein